MSCHYELILIKNLEQCLTHDACYIRSAAAAAKSLQSSPTLCNPMDYTVHGILQARILEWVAVPFSRGPSQPRSPALQADSLPDEPQVKPKNTGVGTSGFS